MILVKTLWKMSDFATTCKRDFYSPEMPVFYQEHHPTLVSMHIFLFNIKYRKFHILTKIIG